MIVAHNKEFLEWEFEFTDTDKNTDNSIDLRLLQDIKEEHRHYIFWKKERFIKYTIWLFSTGAFKIVADESYAIYDTKMTKCSKIEFSSDKLPKMLTIESTDRDPNTKVLFIITKDMNTDYSSYSYHYNRYSREIEKNVYDASTEDNIVKLAFTSGAGSLYYSHLIGLVKFYCFETDIEYQLMEDKGLLDGSFMFKLKGKKKHIENLIYQYNRHVNKLKEGREW